MFTALQQSINRRFQSWLDRRVPASQTVTLNQNKIFIFPSRAGLCFMSVLLVLLLIAINYQSNMVFALVFLLSSMFIITILHTFANLSGLSLTAVRAYPGHVGESAAFEMKLQKANRREYFDISISWPDSEVVNISLREDMTVNFVLHLPAERRGVLRPPRLLLETYYPLGLLRCWTWLAMDIETLVYPRPVEGNMVSSSSSSGEENEAMVTHTHGSEDFYAFRDYQPGDPLKHLAWKSFAKGLPLTTKQFAAYQSQQSWLDWQGTSGDPELRLSILCYWALQQEKAKIEYGLRLPGVEIDPGLGEAHCERVLKQLALFRVS